MLKNLPQNYCTLRQFHCKRRNFFESFYIKRKKNTIFTPKTENFNTMLTCEIKVTGQKIISLNLPSEAELNSGDDTVLTQSVTNKYCDFKIWEYINSQTVVMLKRFSTHEDCTLEAIRSGSKAIIFSAITSGSVSEINGNELITHNVGSVGMGLMSEKNFHVTQVSKGGSFEKLNIIIADEDMEYYMERYPEIFSRFKYVFLSNKPFVKGFYDRSGKITAIAKELRQNLTTGNNSIQYIKNLIVECFVCFFAGCGEPIPETYSKKEKIYTARHILIENFKNPPSLNSLAAMSGTNECTLKKGFKQEFSMTVFEYLFEYRMKLAVNMLKDETLSINNIAANLGFKTLSHFSAAFRKKYGIPPKEFRER